MRPEAHFGQIKSLVKATAARQEHLDELDKDIDEQLRRFPQHRKEFESDVEASSGRLKEFVLAEEPCSDVAAGRKRSRASRNLGALRV
jgi:hypothetical protein